MRLPSLDFESSASTSFTTPANFDIQTYSSVLVKIYLNFVNAK